MYKGLHKKIIVTVEEFYFIFL